jgi:quercetin dioxygenase-like cupin family protein
MATTSVAGVHVPAQAGLERRFGPNRMLFKVGRDCGAKGLGLIVSTFAPGGGYPFLHVHRSFEEAFYVIAGELEYQLGGERVHAQAGSTVFIPPGVPHRFKGVGSEPASIVVIFSSPDGLQMIQDIAAAGPDPQKHAAIFERYDSSLIAD